MLHRFNAPNGEADLFRDLEQFRNEVNRIFSTAYDRRESPYRTGEVGFPVNLYASDDELVLTAELPGVVPEDVALTVEDDVLTIAFERKPEDEGEGISYHRRERAHGRFSRVLELPMRVHADKVEARVDNGVLQVRLPRLPEDKPRKIAINASR